MNKVILGYSIPLVLPKIRKLSANPTQISKEQGYVLVFLYRPIIVQLTPKRLPPAKRQRRQQDGAGNCIIPESKCLESVLVFMVV